MVSTSRPGHSVAPRAGGDLAEGPAGTCQPGPVRLAWHHISQESAPPQAPGVTCLTGPSHPLKESDFAITDSPLAQGNFSLPLPPASELLSCTGARSSSPSMHRVGRCLPQESLNKAHTIFQVCSFLTSTYVWSREFSLEMAEMSYRSPY